MNVDKVGKGIRVGGIVFGVLVLAALVYSIVMQVKGGEHVQLPGDKTTQE